MAEVQRPDAFEFQHPDKWPEWTAQWDMYRDEKLRAEPDEVQITSLLLAMGDEARDTFKSLELSDNQQKQYAYVKCALDEYFEREKHVVQERFQFYTRRQRASETAKDYISRVRKLATSCAFGDISTQIRDRLVSGISDKYISCKMQRMSGAELTEDVATRMILEADKKKVLKRPSTTTVPDSSKAHKRDQLPLLTPTYPIPSSSLEEQSGAHIVVVTPCTTVKTKTSIWVGNTLPENIPMNLQEAISNLKEMAAKMGKHQSFFSNKQVQDLLLLIETESQQQEGQQLWREIYSNLAESLHCKEQTVRNRVNSQRREQEIAVTLSQLKTAVDYRMPELIWKHNKKCDDASAQKASRAALGTPGPRIAAPVRQFEWNEEIRGLLCKVVAIKVKLLSGKKPEKLVDFFEFEVMLLWPERWMTTSKLWTKTAKVHGMKYPKSGNTKKKPVRRSNAHIPELMNTSVAAVAAAAGMEAAAAVATASLFPPSTPSFSSVCVKEERVKEETIDGSTNISSTSNGSTVIELD